MMTNLFSIFDPSSSLLMNTNWLSSLFMILIIPATFWCASSRPKTLIFISLNKMHKEYSTLLSGVSSSTLLFLVCLMLIMLNNTHGLVPYIFTSTSHLSMTLSMALPIWLSFIIFSWLNNTSKALAHCLPQGTPLALMIFMVLIETISNLIRPITLSVRLAANMIAGHLLMTLLGNQVASATFIILPIILIVQILLLALETAVAIIQSYVFTVLSALYASEV